MIRLYFDEDVPEAVAIALRLRGYNVITAREAGKKGLSDNEQLKHASSEERILFTHNIADFSKIHMEFVRKGSEHCGLIFSKQLPVGIIVKALLKLLSRLKAEDVKNKAVWLSDWIEP